MPSVIPGFSGNMSLFCCRFPFIFSSCTTEAITGAITETTTDTEEPAEPQQPNPQLVHHLQHQAMRPETAETLLRARAMWCTEGSTQNRAYIESVAATQQRQQSTRFSCKELIGGIREIKRLHEYSSNNNSPFVIQSVWV